MSSRWRPSPPRRRWRTNLTKALTDGTLLAVTDEKGRKVLVPADKIAYIDLGQEKTRPVGFGSL